jgi:hypothetical protein
MPQERSKRRSDVKMSQNKRRRKFERADGFRECDGWLTSFNLFNKWLTAAGNAIGN